MIATVVSAGCAPRECNNQSECRLGLACNVDGLCVQSDDMNAGQASARTPSTPGAASSVSTNDDDNAPLKVVSASMNGDIGPLHLDNVKVPIEKVDVSAGVIATSDLVDDDH
ncbi:MAG TPA: hypothetical protein VGO62_02740, partial [Myxococcota bacterium]